MNDARFDFVRRPTKGCRAATSCRLGDGTKWKCSSAQLRRRHEIIKPMISSIAEKIRCREEDHTDETEESYRVRNSKHAASRRPGSGAGFAAVSLDESNAAGGLFCG